MDWVFQLLQPSLVGAAHRVYRVWVAGSGTKMWFHTRPQAYAGDGPNGLGGCGRLVLQYDKAAYVKLVVPLLQVTVSAEGHPVSGSGMPAAMHVVALERRGV